MGFLGKFKKNKGDKAGDSDSEELFPDSGPASSDELDLEDEPDLFGRVALEEAPENGEEPEVFGRAALGGELDAEDEDEDEEASGTSRFQTKSVTLTDDDDETPEVADPVALVDTEEDEDASSIGSLMNIFEEVVEVDKQLSNLNSWVE